MNRIITLIVVALLCSLSFGCGNYDDDIARIDDRLSEVNTSIGGLENTDKELKGIITSLEEQAADLSSSIARIDKQLDDSSLSDEVRVELESAKSDLEARLEGINSSIEDLRRKDEEILSRIESLKKEVTGEVTEESAAAVKAEIGKLDASIKEYLASTLAAYYTKDEIAEILKGLCTREEVTELLKGYYTKDEVDVRLMTIEYAPEYADGVVRVPYRVKDGKYSPESFSMTFETSYSGSLKDVVAVEKLRAFYTPKELADSEDLGVAAVLDVLQTEFPSDGVFRITVSPEKLDESFFYGKCEAALIVSLDVKGHKVLLGSYLLTAVQLALAGPEGM